jgi:uncharacterized protein (DUF2141 family)
MKHKFNFFTVLVFISASAMAQHDMEVTIKNIKDQKGTIQLALYNSETDYLKKPITGKVISANTKEVTVSFTNLKPGNYAISVYHDANSNNEFDSNLIGIPKEPYGFSNNAMRRFGPPAFEDAKVILDKQVKLTIELK